MKHRKEYWNKVYEQKQPTEVSWFEPRMKTSLAFIEACELSKDAAIIDVGGGDSYLAELLISRGFMDVTVLDISEAVIERAKKRMGDLAGAVTWIVSDITEYSPDRQFDLWHDRATFHFLTEEGQVPDYLGILRNSLSPKANVIMSTFSENGPQKCSGLRIRQYSKEDLKALFTPAFKLLECRHEVHETPFQSTQEFTFCRFQKVLMDGMEKK